MQRLKIGDVVKLRSGSPSMTIVKVIGTKVWTSWFIDDQHERALFPSESLVSVRASNTSRGASAN